MTTTRISFASAVYPDDHTRNFLQFRIDTPGRHMRSVATPPFDISAHEDAIARYEAGNPNAPNLVSEIGEALWTCLQTHGNAQEAFRETLTPGQPDAQIALSFDDNTDAASRLPWEALRERDEFVSFDKRVPIVRMVETGTENAPFSIAEGEALRFLAVIAAAGDTGAGEWDALKRALNSVAGELPLDVLVLTSQKPTLETRGGENFPVTFAPVKRGTAALIQDIQEFGPHIAHFFCHGHPNNLLEIEPSAARHGEKVKNWMARADIEQALDLSAWVTVLNACSLGGAGANPPAGVEETEERSEGTRNLCEKLIEGGFPLVVGMRRAIDARDAHAFAEHFHTNALREISGLIGNGAGSVKLARSFGDACRAILNAGDPADPRHVASWTLPIMYLRPDELQLKRLGLGPGPDEDALPPGPDGGPDRRATLDAAIARQELMGEIAALEDALAEHAGAFQGSVDVIKARIEELRAQLGS